MWLASPKEAARRRNASPICCRHAGDGTGYPRWLRNWITLPADLQLRRVAAPDTPGPVKHDHPAHPSPPDPSGGVFHSQDIPKISDADILMINVAQRERDRVLIRDQHVTGKLACIDRLIFKGHLTGLSGPGRFKAYLASQGCC